MQAIPETILFDGREIPVSKVGETKLPEAPGQRGLDTLWRGDAGNFFLTVECWRNGSEPEAGTDYFSSVLLIAKALASRWNFPEGAADEKLTGLRIVIDLTPVAHALLVVLAKHKGWASPNDALLGSAAGSIRPLCGQVLDADNGVVDEWLGVRVREEGGDDAE